MIRGEVVKCSCESFFAIELAQVVEKLFGFQPTVAPQDDSVHFVLIYQLVDQFFVGVHSEMVVLFLHAPKVVKSMNQRVYRCEMQGMNRD